MWRRLSSAMPVAALALCLALIAATAGLNGYLRRGGVWGEAVATIKPTSHALGANTFLHLEADRDKIERTAIMLQEAGITYVRQQFAWNEIEPSRDVFVDEQGHSTWDKYDYIVETLAKHGVQVLARPENTPDWARPGQDTIAAPFGPPTAYSDYAQFVERIVRRYPGKVTAVQVWNEPNLAHEWGERDPDPAAYADLLRQTFSAVKAADPGVVVIAAGLAPTDGLAPGAMNDLLFLEGMYQAGARGSFDALAVMIYGLGQSPDDRRVGLRHPINFSRPVLTREMMVKYGDGGTPVWATEYGWISVPPDWTGRPSTWGDSVSESRQAAYLVRGLDRIRHEWPWMGVVCVWAFRFVESTMPPNDPQRHFAIVRNDFTPRPAYTALADRAIRGLATSGTYAVTDPALQFSGAWETQVLGGREYRLASVGARLRVDFSGSRVSVLARRTVDGGRLYATIDGQPAAGLRTAAGRAYISLSADRTGDASVLVANGLPPGQHTLELTAGDQGVIAVTGVAVAAERPTGWAFRWLHGVLLLGLWLSLWLSLRQALRAIGYLPATPLASLFRRRAWR